MNIFNNHIVGFFKIAFKFLLLLVKLSYQVIMFFVETCNDFAVVFLVGLTAIYVVFTYNIVKESRTQSNIMMINTQHMQKAYLYIDIDDFQVEGEYPIKQIKKGILCHPLSDLKGKFKFNLFNEGKTPAYLIYWFYFVDSLSPIQYNIRDSLLSCEEFTFVKGLDLPSVIVQGHDYTWEKKFKNKTTNRNGQLFIHAYFVYKDVFDVYHDVYAVREYAVDLNRMGAFNFPPIVDPYTFKKGEFETILSKMNIGND